MFVAGVLIGILNGIVLGGIMYRLLVENRTTGQPGALNKPLNRIFGHNRAKIFPAPLDADIQIKEHIKKKDQRGEDTTLEEIL